MNKTSRLERALHDETSQQLADLFPTADEIPAEFRIDTGGYLPRYLQDGEVRRWEGPLAPVSSPICVRENGTIKRPILASVPAMDESTALAALDAARGAWSNGQGPWPLAHPEARIEAVEAFLSSMSKAKEEIVRLLMWEIGKSLEESRAEVDRTIDYIRMAIEATREACKAEVSSHWAGGIAARVKAAPIGVCLLMGPFNNPVYETYTMLVPALLAGNTAVVKVPKFGVLPHQLFFRCLAESFPKGVVNYIYGGETGEDIAGSLMRTGCVDVLSFIGSSAGAAALVSRHPKPLRLRRILSLGAKNPGLITADADIETAVRECVLGSLGFNGQRCTALKILFVHESVADKFLREFCRGVDALPIGMPWEKGVKITPLPEFDKTVTMAAYVDDALGKGAVVVNSGGGDSSATLFRPAVVYPVAATSELYEKEQVGPVVPVHPYRKDEELLEFVASGDYGQQVSLFSGDPEKTADVVGRLSNLVGRINLNCKCQRGPDVLPFAGRKDSGMTALSVSETLKAFSMPSVIAARSHEGDEGLLLKPHGMAPGGGHGRQPKRPSGC
jgi:glyceraldehyde-3-phosphate dehydrogenase (NADP+)